MTAIFFMRCECVKARWLQLLERTGPGEEMMGSGRQTPWKGSGKRMQFNPNRLMDVYLAGSEAGPMNIGDAADVGSLESSMWQGNRIVVIDLMRQ